MLISKFKKTVLGLMMVSGALFIDANGYIPQSSGNVEQAGRILGTGVKDSPGPCVDYPDGTSFRVVTHSVTILWVQLGDSWTTTEPC